MNGFGDSFWEIVGIFFAILAIVVALVIYFLQKRTKKLSYEILQKSQIVSYSDDVKEKLQIFYEGTQVNKVSLIEVRITNSGNTPILPNDYLENLSLFFSQESKILSVDVIEQIPENLKVQMTVHNSQVEISSVLLNPQDTFCLKLIVNDASELQLKARIIGIKEIELHIENPSLGLKNLIISFIFTVIASVLSKFQPLQYDVNDFLVNISVGIAIVLVYLPIFTNKKYIDRLLNAIRKILK